MATILSSTKILAFPNKSCRKIRALKTGFDTYHSIGVFLAGLVWKWSSKPSLTIDLKLLFKDLTQPSVTIDLRLLVADLTEIEFIREEKLSPATEERTSRRMMGSVCSSEPATEKRRASQQGHGEAGSSGIRTELRRGSSIGVGPKSTSREEKKRTREKTIEQGRDRASRRRRA